MDLRCDHKMHGRVEDGTLEVMCRSALCGKRPGVVVMHYFNLKTGEMTTRKYKDPLPAKEGESHAMGHLAAVRHA
jgi:hypothetical protein